MSEPMSIADVLMRAHTVRLLSNDQFPFLPNVRQCIRDAKRVRADRVAEDLFVDGYAGRFDSSLPYKMPFDLVWIEWSIRQQWAKHQRRDFAVLLERSPYSEYTGRKVDGATDAFLMQMYSKAPSGYADVTIAGSMDLHVTADGQLLGSTYDPRRFGITDNLAGRLNTVFTMPAVMALALMNCKNVTLPTTQPTVRLAKKSRPERIPRLSFHTIQLPGESHAPGSSHHSVDPVERAHHLVRGHFKTYTADAPLLGKAVGTYWWGWQARGSKKNGIVVSDYEVGVA